MWRIHSHIIVKKTSAYTDAQTNEEYNKTQMHPGRLSLDLHTFFMFSLSIMYIIITIYFDFIHVSI